MWGTLENWKLLFSLSTVIGCNFLTERKVPFKIMSLDMFYLLRVRWLSGR